MIELERFVHHLIDTLRVRDPAGVHRPVTIDDLRRSLLPYRVHRNALGLSAAEDYDLLVLRLCAEEGGYVRTFPAEAAERCRAEVSGPNPDLSLVEELGQATVQIGAASLVRLFGREPSHEAPSAAQRTEPVPAQPSTPAPPPPPPAAPTIEPAVEIAPPLPAPPTSQTETSCRFCGAGLPVGKRVVFCPHCGQRLEAVRCQRCGTELDAGWRHCITCGAPVAVSGAPA